MTAEPARDLVSVLEAILREWHCDEDADELTPEESRRVQRLIRDILEITDSPSSREPYQIADFVYWNCASASRAAAERYLAAMSAAEIAKFNFADVLSCLSPGLYNDIEELAIELEDERRGE